jgi:hypothetical protein
MPRFVKLKTAIEKEKRQLKELENYSEEVFIRINQKMAKNLTKIMQNYWENDIKAFEYNIKRTMVTTASDIAYPFIQNKINNIGDNQNNPYNFGFSRSQLSHEILHLLNLGYRNF